MKKKKATQKNHAIVICSNCNVGNKLGTGLKQPPGTHRLSGQHEVCWDMVSNMVSFSYCFAMEVFFVALLLFSPTFCGWVLFPCQKKHFIFLFIEFIIKSSGVFSLWLYHIWSILQQLPNRVYLVYFYKMQKSPNCLVCVTICLEDIFRDCAFVVSVKKTTCLTRLRTELILFWLAVCISWSSHSVMRSNTGFIQCRCDVTNSRLYWLHVEENWTGKLLRKLMVPCILPLNQLEIPAASQFEYLCRSWWQMEEEGTGSSWISLGVLHWCTKGVRFTLSLHVTLCLYSDGSR